MLSPVTKEFLGQKSTYFLSKFVQKIEKKNWGNFEISKIFVNKNAIKSENLGGWDLFFCKNGFVTIWS